MRPVKAEVVHLLLLKQWRLKNLYRLRDASIRKRGAAPVAYVELHTLDDAVWRTYFRFSKAEVYRLVEASNLPQYIKASNGIKEKSDIALCMLLARLTYSNRYTDLRLKFGWEITRVSRIHSAI